jgi:pimeloyl-ACP methyl ester carboxylesterase
MTHAEIAHLQTPALDLAYFDFGPADGEPVVLLHGFPYDPHSYDAVAPPLAEAGCRVLVPYLRGYGPTRFRFTETPRSGQQAALGKDLLDFLDALQITTATLVGYDWGGRAACIVAALWPDRVRALVSAGGYNIQDIAGSVRPAPPEHEHRLWYQYYFATERGRAGLAANRYEFCRLLWRLWSPSWRFSDETYARSAAAFDNPDFVEVVIHSYRHRYGYVPGDPSLQELETLLAARPPIAVPTTALYGGDDGVAGPAPTGDAPSRQFTSTYRARVLPGVGHNPAQERPDAVVEAVRELILT